MSRVMLLALVLSSSNALGVDSDRPYAGQENRAIKALSAERIAGYLEGSGMGFAKAAELNHYPGPKHVLELSDELGLTEEQATQTRVLFERMQATARRLGAELVERETELDRAFATRQVTPESLAALLGSIAILEGKIRLVHLAAHLDQRRLLTGQQVKLYDQLRGYDGAEGQGQQQHRHDH